MNLDDSGDLTGSLTAKQRRAIGELIALSTQKAAAQTVGVSENTLIAWMRKPEFRRALADAESAVLGETMRALGRASHGAVLVLELVTNDADAPPTARVSAARAILDATLTVRSALAFDERLAALEQRLGGVK